MEHKSFSVKRFALSVITFLLVVQSTHAQTPQPPQIPGSWNLVFTDDFHGTSLNTNLWTSGWITSGISGPVNDAETTCYDSELVTVADGFLKLPLIAQQNTCKGVSRPNTGSIINSGLAQLDVKL